MTNLITLVVLIVTPSAIWWLYGPEELASAARSGFRFLVPILFGVLGGIAAGWVSNASGASAGLLVGIALGTTALAGIPIMIRLRAKKGVELGAPEEVPVPRTEVDHVWVLPLERYFECERCGYYTDHADRPWCVLRTTGACPRCGKPALAQPGPVTTLAVHSGSSPRRYPAPRPRLTRSRDSGALTEREHLDKLIDMLDRTAV
jgi:hypothetical protein